MLIQMRSPRGAHCTFVCFLAGIAERIGRLDTGQRITEALEGTDVPRTPAIAACRDQDVLGRAFYLMGFVEGWSPMGIETGPNGERPWPAPFDTDLEARRGLAFQLVEGIALLGAVDWQAKGLADLGRPDGFHERQVDRWTAFLDRIKGRELPGFDEAAACHVAAAEGEDWLVTRIWARLHGASALLEAFRRTLKSEA